MLDTLDVEGDEVLAPGTGDCSSSRVDSRRSFAEVVSYDRRPHREFFVWRSRGSTSAVDSSISRVMDSLAGVSLIYPMDTAFKALNENLGGAQEIIHSPDKSMEATDILGDGTGQVNGLEGSLNSSSSLDGAGI